MLRKGVSPYEYMDSWQRFNETKLPTKEKFCSNLNMEDITDLHYKHTKRVWKDFRIKNLGDYHLSAQTGMLLLADVFENFLSKFIEIHEVDPAPFFSTPVWQACLKKTEIELELLTDIDMLEKVVEGIRQNMLCNSSICKGK